MSTTGNRSILHVDMDAFYASVECVDDPSLRGKPLLVGGTGGRGVVSAASYEARVFGCRSAMPMIQAMRLCPQAIVKPLRFHRYREVSRQIFELFHRFTPTVEGLSLDEAFLDLTGTERLLGDAVGIARHIKSAVREETGCTCSVGVSYCKFLAKLASDLEKPDGLTVFGPDQVRDRMPELPVTRIWGVGAKTATKLAGYSIHKIGDLRSINPTFLQKRFGDDALHLIDLAFGRDERAVVTDRDAKSIGSEQTFGADLTSANEVRQELLSETEHVAWRLRKAAVRARTVTVKIRTSDFRTVTRSATLDAPTDVTSELWEAAKGCFDVWCKEHFAPVRLVGMQAKDLHPAAATQLGLFTENSREKQSKLDAATDKIKAKFGEKSIHRAGS